MKYPDHLTIQGTRWSRISYDEAFVEVYFPTTSTSAGGNIKISVLQASALQVALRSAMQDITDQLCMDAQEEAQQSFSASTPSDHLPRPDWTKPATKPFTEEELP